MQMDKTEQSYRRHDGMICTTKGPTRFSQQSKTPKFELDRLKCKTVHRCLAVAVEREAHMDGRLAV
ncbi:hypothetical protein GALMADRAFT_237251 [Galerina marginata CBS 339.88]|uniref:Uncharacterized protein n=1 Tax=Galerina marginata (strain CBS 339.88) TaxID=685588 RepID=A0A067TWR0_GALM3|nr:hypothetical protein GALMADRAFT_237251 [Galerina marginata CBS 339.88]